LAEDDATEFFFVPGQPRFEGAVQAIRQVIVFD